MNKDSVALADTIDSQIERFKLTPQYESILGKWMDCQ